ncbi:hypothetical protein SAMN06265348_10162 [Pedobacter westerhofensis]|uniref:Glucose / Sorbosone dehydrogenase n=1 Tax=Pedobacter westerhofensis TaxID=425512 RepID=A0A521AD38_9SPHI|nr:hypothetical protein [Pedobacter westerhofensis]SMO32610.1 hypothetical protein SAMN06265348_10162 [Pedobacter westerhofensis]
MKLSIISLLLLVSIISRAQIPVNERDVNFDLRIVADKLSDPWSIVIAPDQYIWATEAKGYRVLRINPSNGEKQQLLDLNSEKNFGRYDKIPDHIDHGKPWP